MKQLAICLALIGGSALAEPVEVSFTAPAALADAPVFWEALPIDITGTEGEVFPVASDEGITGPWTVALEPGLWQVTGLAGADFLNGQVTVAAAGESHEIAIEPPLPPPPYACPDVVVCHFTDSQTLIGFDLPQGWAADQPFVADLGGGVTADRVSVVFFEDAEGEGGEAWFLNPAEWYDEIGPCREVALGNLCTQNLGEVSEGAFQIIAPSLRRVTAEEAAAP
ncbi:MAG: hypothetical protein WAT25_01210 [Paracoccaceae bacterium]|jgi:hypothetical protein|nr:hypothetical protein [Rhodobacter sp.]